MKRTVCILLILSCCTALSAQQSMLDKYKAFQQSAKQDYTDFREAANARYADFLRSSWELYQAYAPVTPPVEEEVPPVIFEEKKQEEKPVIEEQKPEPKPEPKPEDKPLVQEEEREPIRHEAPIPYRDVVIQPQPVPQPKPLAPVVENNSRTERTLTVSFYGTELSFRYPLRGFMLTDTGGDALAKAWMVLAGKDYDNLLYDCLAARDELSLCDWAYLKLLQQVCEGICGQGDAAVFMQAFLYTQSGYQMRLARNAKGKLFLLIGSDFVFYDRPYFRLSGSRFFPLNKPEDGTKEFSICPGKFDQEQPFSLLIPYEQQLTREASAPRVHISREGVKVQVSLNENLIRFYGDYPTGHYGDDIGTRWAMYANMPMEQSLRDSLYPVLRNALFGSTEQEAVNILLNWVQTGFVYEFDEKVWGGDRAFFPAETLYYPYCDCEDRSILFSRLVRDLLDLDVVLLYYPGHLASAVAFSYPIGGDYLVYNDKHYTVCDPTYIGAPVGATMPKMDNATAKIIPLQR